MHKRLTNAKLSLHGMEAMEPMCWKGALQAIVNRMVLSHIYDYARAIATGIAHVNRKRRCFQTVCVAVCVRDMCG